MKLRTGFVSNSSSSSFVIGAPQGDTPKLTISVEIDLADFSEYQIDTVEQLDAYYKEEHCWGPHTLEDIFEDDPQILAEYNKVKALLEAGNTVFCGTVSNEYDKPISMYLYNRRLQTADMPEGYTLLRNY